MTDGAAAPREGEARTDGAGAEASEQVEQVEPVAEVADVAEVAEPPPGMASEPEAVVPAASSNEPETQPLTRVQRREAERHAVEHVVEDAPPYRPVAVVIGVVVAVAVLLAVTISVGPLLGGAGIAFAGLVVAWGWPTLTDVPDPARTSVVIAVGSVGIAVSVATTRSEPYLVWLPVALAVAVLVAFLQQVTRGGGRPHLTLGAASTTAALGSVASGAMMVVLPAYPHGTSYVVVAMAAVGVAALAEVLGAAASVARWVLLPVVVLAAGAALGTAALLGDVTPVLRPRSSGCSWPGRRTRCAGCCCSVPGARGTAAYGALGAASRAASRCRGLRAGSGFRAAERGQ